jgi:uncharacterized protein (TIRG00374 family)
MSELDKRQALKIRLGILIGLVVVGLLFLTNSRQIRFIEGKNGTHCWTDTNQNGTIDFHDSSEFYLCQKGNYRRETLGDVLHGIDWKWNSVILLISAFLFMGLRDFFYMIRIRLLSDKQLSWKASFHTIMLWEFASALSPGVMSGAAVAMFILHRERIPLGKSTSMVMVTAMLDNLFFTTMIPCVFLIYGAEVLFPEGSGLISVFWMGYSVFFFVFLFFFISVFFLPGLVPSFLTNVMRLPFLKRWRERTKQTATDIRLAAVEMRTYPFHLWLKLLGSTFASWISRFLVINFLMAAFINLSVFQHALILSKQFILWLFMRMSPTPGGSGVAEYVFGELMQQPESSILLILGLAFIWRILSYYSYLLIGTLILPKWLRKGFNK